MKIYPSLSELRPDIIKYWSNKNECIPSEMRVSLYSHKYVWVICPLCNKEFQKTYNAIINSGCYCKECSNKVCSKYEKSLRYKYPDIADMYDSSEKNKLSSDKVFSRSDEEYYFKCNKCGIIFKKSCNSMIDSYLKGNNGCGVCNGNRVEVGVNDIKTKNKLAYRYWDFNKNNTLPEYVHYRSKSYYYFKCSKNHSFKSTVDRIYLRSIKGLQDICPICMGTEVIEGVNDCKTFNPYAIKLWDYNKNIDKPENVYYKSEKKYWFKCSKGHEFQRDLLGMYKSYERSENSERVSEGCPVCSKSLLIVGKNDCKTLNPYAYKYWDYLRNGINPEDVYYKSHNKYWYKCSEGHSFQRSAYAMYRSYMVDNNGGNSFNGCIICSDRKLPEKCISGVNDIKTLYPELMDMWDYEINDQLGIKPWEVTKGSQKKVWVHCVNDKCKNSFEVSVQHFINGHRLYCDDCKGLHHSKVEKELVTFIKDLGLNVIEEYELSNGMSVDMYIPDKNIAFDYNGLYWHSEHKGRGKWYHYNKIQECKKSGFRLYYIWEDDYKCNKDRILDWVKEKLGVSNNVKVNARDCIVKILNKNIAKDFLNKYHIQGFSEMSSNIGLYHKDELVAVLSYAMDNSSYDLINIKRYATSCNVRGGFSKLLSKLEKYGKELGYNGIITFSDNSISDGDLYFKTGFVNIEELEPTYSYLVNGKREHKFKYRIKRFKNDSNLQYKEGMSEKELAELNKLYRVYDSGKVKWYKEI